MVTRQPEKGLPEIATLPEYFRKHGYQAEGYGKVYHHHGNGAFNDPEAWDKFRKMDAQFMPASKLNGAKRYGSRNTDWGRWPKDEQETETIDFKSVGYAEEAWPQTKQALLFGLRNLQAPFPLLTRPSIMPSMTGVSTCPFSRRTIGTICQWAQAS